MARKKATSKKVNVGDFVRITETAYRNCWYEGIVTESFSDMVQIFAVNDRSVLEHHELNLSEIRIQPIDKEKVRFRFDQALREIKQSSLKAEIKFKEMQNLFQELDEKYTAIFRNN